MIKIIKKPSYLRTLIDSERCKGRTVGFVPTMGNLHDGHMSLIERSVKQCDITAVSIFVNPIQFGANEDLSAYPRTFSNDRKKLAEARCDIVFYPRINDMYKNRMTTVHVSDITEGLCGASRPGHFDGVTTVVAKLLHIVNPHYAFFGEKDYQQLMAVKKMVFDLNMPVNIVGCPIVREQDGLAMSSRNAYLSHAERAQAPLIYRSLKKGSELLMQGKGISLAKRRIVENLRGIDNGHIDYVEILDQETLKKPDTNSVKLRIFAAVFIGRTRLIDNIGVRIK